MSALGIKAQATLVYSLHPLYTLTAIPHQLESLITEYYEWPGVKVRYARKAGVCAACRARLVTGKVTMAGRFGLSDDDIAKRYKPDLPVHSGRRRRVGQFRSIGRVVRRDALAMADECLESQFRQIVRRQLPFGIEPGVSPIDHPEEQHRLPPGSGRIGGQIGPEFDYKALDGIYYHTLLADDIGSGTVGQMRQLIQQHFLATCSTSIMIHECVK